MVSRGGDRDEILKFARTLSRIARTARSACGSHARKRAQQRWSALLTANGSRIAREMRGALGEACWEEFLADVEPYYKHRFLDAFDPPDGLLQCVGKYGSGGGREEVWSNFGGCPPFLLSLIVW